MAKYYSVKRRNRRTGRIMKSTYMDNKEFRTRVYRKARKVKGKGQLKRIAGMAKSAWKRGNPTLSQQLWIIQKERAAFLSGVAAGKKRSRKKRR